MTSALSTLDGKFGSTNLVSPGFFSTEPCFPAWKCHRCSSPPHRHPLASPACPPLADMAGTQSCAGFPASPEATCSKVVLNLLRVEEHCLRRFLHLDCVVYGERTENPPCLVMTKCRHPQWPCPGRHAIRTHDGNNAGGRRAV